MGLVCIRDHRPEHSLDHSGATTWLNGCAQCEVKALEATLSRQQAAYEREIELDVAEMRRRCAELVAAVRDANAKAGSVVLLTAAQEAAWLALVAHIERAA